MHRILYVDDEPSLLEIGTLFLEQSGDFTVTTALSGPEAIQLLEQEKFDAIIADYQMPGMDGIQFLTEIRKRFGSVPFILFTGRGREDVVIQAINSGADFYLQKGGEPSAQFAELTHKTLIAINHHRAAEKIQSLNRLYSVLSAINKAIFHIRTKNEFFSEICQILVKTGEFRMAWIGLAGPDHTIIRPVASAGYTEGYLDSINISTEDVPRGRGPTGTAFREGKYYISNDILHDPVMEPWRENALKRGYLANAAFPFALGTKNAGVLSLYAPVTGFFDDEIVELLNELSLDIAVSLKAIDDENDRALAEEALRKSEAQLKRAEEIGRSGSWEIRLNEKTVFASEGARLLYNLTGTQWTLETVQEIPFPEYRPLLDAALRDLIAGNAPYDVEFRSRGPTEGSVLDIHSLAEYDPRRNTVFGVIHDITGQKRVEEALRESEEKYRILLEESPDPIFSFNPEGRYTYANQALAEAFETPVGEIIGRTIWDFFPRIVAEKRVLSLSHVFRTGEKKVIEGPVPRKDGDRYYVTTITPIKDVSGKVISAICSAKDITGRKRVEEALRESEEKFRKIFANSAFGMVLARPDFQFLLVNPAWISMLGYTEEELLRLSFKDITHPDDLVGDIEGMRALEAGTVPVYHTEKRYFRKDGSTLWGSINVTAIRNQSGDLRYYVAQIEDITPRKNADAKLQESENKFATIFQSSPVALTLVSATEGTFVDVNEAFLRNTGYSRNEVIGVTADTLGIFADRDASARMFSSLRHTRFLYGVELKCRIKTGEIRTCIFSSSLILMGKTPHIISTIEDVTERKQVEVAFQAMVRSMVGTTGLNSLQKITESVASWLGADCVMIGEIQPDNQTVKVLSMLLDGKEIVDFSYILKGTPCEVVIEKGFSLYLDNVTRFFPESMLLANLNIRGYAGTPLRDSRGKVIGILCVLSRSPLTPSQITQEIMDIIAVKAAAEIERTQIERSFRDSEEVFRAVFNNANDAIFLHEMHPDGSPGHYFRVNDIACERLGYSREELFTMSPRDIVSPRHHSEIMPGVIATMRSQGFAIFEGIYQRKDGSTFPVEVSTHMFPLQGRQVALSIARDIARWKKSEEALLESRQILEAILNTVPVRVFWKDRSLTYLGGNAPFAADAGFERPEDIIGKDDYAMPWRDQADLYRSDDNFVIHNGMPKLLIEEPQTTPSGSQIYILTSKVPLRDASGEITGVLGTYLDITGRKVADEALRAANKKLNLLSGITRHDINNQISVLLGYLRILEKKQTDPALNVYIQKLAIAAQRISAMIQFTKEYEQLGVNGPVWQHIGKISEMAAVDLLPENVQLIVDTGNYEVFADPMLSLVLYNLFENAKRHGGHVTKICVRLVEKGNTGTLIIEDNGVGIPASLKERIFERGFGSNTGFGLYLIGEILPITGLSIKETGTEGKGARFEINLPPGTWRRGSG